MDPVEGLAHVGNLTIAVVALMRARAAGRRVEQMQAEQVEALKTMGATMSERAQRERVLEERQRRAEVRVRVVQGTGGNDLFIIENLGPGEAVVREVHIETTDPDPMGLELPLRLVAGESRNYGFSTAMGTPWPLEVEVAWTDASGPQIERYRVAYG